MQKKAKKRSKKKRVEANLDDMYHEGEYSAVQFPESEANDVVGEGHFDESAKPSGAATPVSNIEGPPGAPGGKKRKNGLSKKAKTAKQRLAVADGEV